jgi:hypothetical protein
MTAEDKTLLSANYMIDAPCWSRDGSRIFFTSDETGVFNLHSVSVSDGKRIQETHLLSGGFSPDMAADGTIAVSLYTSRGFRVAQIAGDRLLSGRTVIPAIRDNRYRVNEEYALTAAPPAKVSTEPVSSPYSPWQSLAPRFWLPSMIADGPEDVAPGILTAGQDILGYHTFMGSAWYGTGFKKGYFDVFYRYGRFIPELTLQGYALPITYTDLFDRGDYTELEKGFIASISLPVTKLESGFSLTAGYHLKDQRHLSNVSGNLFNGLKVFQGRRDSFFAGLDYMNSLKYPWSISSEEGRTISARINYYGKASGSDIDAREYTLSWEEHARLYRHQTLFLRVNGGMAEGEHPPQQSFQLGGATSTFNPFGVRGYDSRFQTGSYVVTGTMEYRFPAWYFLSGFGTKPIFFDRLHGALFVDGGEIWDRDRSFRGKDIMIGAGTEIRMDLVVGYWLKITPSIGYAHGFDNRYGKDRLLINVSANF